jgi:hypothetical protein
MKIANAMVKKYVKNDIFWPFLAIFWGILGDF